jgi:hypothetical protein
MFSKVFVPSNFLFISSEFFKSPNSALNSNSNLFAFSLLIFSVENTLDPPI